MSDSLITCSNASKAFCRDFKKSLWYGLRDSARDVFGQPPSDDRELRPGEFWSNREISFDVKRGECLGLIGKNGSGKTTLLKMLNGLIKPEVGEITVRGRVGALIALGAGFNPVLTGRENIFINGAILGLSRREIAAKLDDIVDFADVESAIDSPVRTYSSGMQVRLGFAVATALEPDVLLIDEVLAVGDTNFKIRCYNRIREVLPNTAVIFVSHNMFDVSRVCTSVLVLDQGQPKFLGGIEDAVQVYNDLNEEALAEEDYAIGTFPGISDVKVRTFSSQTTGIETSVNLAFTFKSDKTLSDQRLRFVFFDNTSNAVAEWDSHFHNLSYPVRAGANSVEASVDGIRLKSGRYRMAVVLTEPTNTGYTISIDRGINLIIRSDSVAGAPVKI